LRKQSLHMRQSHSVCLRRTQLLTQVKAPRVFVNFRDMCQAMCVEASYNRVLTLAAALSSMPSSSRPEGIIFEDPTGYMLPLQVGQFSADVRRVMVQHGWPHGHLLLHMHHSCGTYVEKEAHCCTLPSPPFPPQGCYLLILHHCTYVVLALRSAFASRLLPAGPSRADSSEACVLEALANGASGIWCGVSRVGAAVGHCSSIVTLFNLHRLGNPFVAQDFDLPAIRAAAIEVTRITTGKDPSDYEEVYGARASDIVFPKGLLGSGNEEALASSLRVKLRNRGSCQPLTVTPSRKIAIVDAAIRESALCALTSRRWRRR
jgi:hypothetical protein